MFLRGFTRQSVIARKTLRAIAIGIAGMVSPAPIAAQQSPVQDYLVFVATEANDEVAVVRWGPDGAETIRRQGVGFIPNDPDGPHGVNLSPDGTVLYVTTAHGLPFGYLWKYDAESGRELGKVALGNFPATLQVSSDGAFAYVANFNLHGDMVPSSVSVVALEPMLEVSRIETCTMPHGARLGPEGRYLYSLCMMDDLLVQIDTRTLEVSHHFHLAPGREHGMAGPPHMDGHEAAGHSAVCSPTWVQPAPYGSTVFVACNKTNDVVELDTGDWSVIRRIPMGKGVYNLGVTSDGRLLVGTNKKEQSVSVVELSTGEEAARLSTSRPVPHGVTISPDDRYAFVSVEGIGSEPGTVEVIDLERLTTAGTADVGQMAGGIVFWKMESR